MKIGNFEVNDSAIADGKSEELQALLEKLSESVEKAKALEDSVSEYFSIIENLNNEIAEVTRLINTDEDALMYHNKYGANEVNVDEYDYRPPYAFGFWVPSSYGC